MTRCFRFLLRFSLINLAVFAAAAAVIMGGAFVTDVPSGNTNLFSTYFDGFPALSLFILFMMAFSMTSTLTLALNFGATRKALFVALQGCWPSTPWAAGPSQLSFPSFRCGSAGPGRAATVLMLNTSPAFLAAAAAAAVLGVLSGVMMIRSRVIGSIVIILAMLLMMAGTFWLVITGGAFSGGMWGDLPWLLPLALGLAAVAADVFLYRYLKGYVVR